MCVCVRACVRACVRVCVCVCVRVCVCVCEFGQPVLDTITIQPNGTTKLSNIKSLKDRQTGRQRHRYRHRERERQIQGGGGGGGEGDPFLSEHAEVETFQASSVQK